MTGSDLGSGLGFDAVATVGAISCTAITVLLWGGPSGRSRRRLSRLTERGEPRRPGPERRGSQAAGSSAAGSSAAGSSGALRRRLLAVAAGLAAVLALGAGPAALIAGVAVAVGCDRWSRRARPATAGERARAARLAADLPIATDLLAACLQGGATWPQAIQAVGDAIGGPLGAELRGLAAQIRLGVDPATAWLALAGDRELAPLARTAARAWHSGTASAVVLRRLADDGRRAARAEAMARARSAGVWAVAPLGLCFLPAFVLLGIVPAIAGIAASIGLP